MGTRRAVKQHESGARVEDFSKNSLEKMSGQPFVEKPPSILNKPDGSAQFECIVQGKGSIEERHKNSTSIGHPEPEVKWYFKGEELENDDRHMMKKKKMVGKFACTLVIKVCAA